MNNLVLRLRQLAVEPHDPIRISWFSWYGNFNNYPVKSYKVSPWWWGEIWHFKSPNFFQSFDPLEFLRELRTLNFQ